MPVPGLRWRLVVYRFKQSDRNTSVQRQGLVESKKAPTPPAVLTNTAPETAGPSRDTAPVGTKRISPGPIGNRPKKRTPMKHQHNHYRSKSTTLNSSCNKYRMRTQCSGITKQSPLTAITLTTLVHRATKMKQCKEKNDVDDDTRNTLLQHSIKLNAIDDSLAEL